MSKFSKEEQQRFLRQMQNLSLDSQSELEDSFYEKEKVRMNAEISSIRNQKNNNNILEQLKKNMQQQQDMMTEFEQDMGELQKITKNQTKNVIDNKILEEIKTKVAQHSNHSYLQLADEQYNQSVLQQSQVNAENLLANKSFYKKSVISQQINKEEEVIKKKIEIANSEREQLSMEQQDKLSMKYEMQCLSKLFGQRFVRPKLKKLEQKDVKIQIKTTKLKNTFTNLTPLVINQENVLPKNAPEIALKQLKQSKRKSLKVISTNQIKIISKKVTNQVDKFEEIPVGQQLAKEDFKKQNLQKIFLNYIAFLSKFISEIEQISNSYSPKFLKYLQASEKNVNYEFQVSQKNQIARKQRLLSQVVSVQNARAYKQLKLTLQQVTSLSGIQHFINIEDAELQFNSILQIQPIQDCQKLIQLNISYNKLKNITPVSTLPWLRLLNVEHNSIVNLSIHCKSLEVIYAGHNVIEDLDLNDNIYLRILLLNKNKLNLLPKLKLYNLEQLNLSKNQLKIITNLQELILLKKLDVSCNRVEQLTESMIYLYLNELNLSNNNLAMLNLLFLPCLQKLYLNNNRLCLRSQKQVYLPNLKQLNLDQNKLQGFSLIWSLILYSRNLQIIKYNNNEYFLSLREKIRQIYEYIIYKYMNNIKIINESNLDIGIKKYLEENYQIYFNHIQLFRQNHNIIKYIENSIKFILHEFNFGRQLQTNRNGFTKEKQYIHYQSAHKIDRLKHIITYATQYSQKNSKILTSKASIFYHYDHYELRKRRLYHLMKTLIVKYKYKKHLKSKYFQKNKNIIYEGLIYLMKAHRISQIRKSVFKFGYLLKGMNQNQAAIKIQKIWRGYVRRKLYKKIMNLKKQSKNQDSDMEDVDTDFFNQQLQKYQFDVDMEGFQDVIIRPEVFQMLKDRSKKESDKGKDKLGSKGNKPEEKGPLKNNFLQSQTKLKSPSNERQMTAQQKMMKQWHITDPRLLKTLQYKNQKKLEARKKQEDKLLTASERYERFKKQYK